MNRNFMEETLQNLRPKKQRQKPKLLIETFDIKTDPKILSAMKLSLTELYRNKSIRTL